jgi:hypothetical protein
VLSRSAEVERTFLCSLVLGEEGAGEDEGEEEERRGEEGTSSGSELCAGLVMLMLEFDREGVV